MNSMSKGYYDSCGKERRKEEKQCPTIVKCGCPGSATLPIAAAAGTTLTLASLTLDTSCLCDPNTKLEFASNIIAPVGTTAGAFTIQIFKQCRNQMTAVPVGPAWSFSTTTPLARTFSFFICDSDSCINDCCTYTAVATVTTAPAGGAISVNNATLGAVSTCKSNACTTDCNRRRCHCECDY